MKRISLFSILLFLVANYSFSQMVVSDPTGYAMQVTKWTESLEKATSQIQELQDSKKLLQQGIDLYSEVSHIIKTSELTLSVINRQVDIISKIGAEFSRPNVLSVKGYQNYTERLKKLLQQNKSNAEVLKNILSKDMKMTDGERLTMLLDIDNRSKEIEDEFHDLNVRYNRLEKQLRQIEKLR